MLFLLLLLAKTIWLPQQDFAYQNIEFKLNCMEKIRRIYEKWNGLLDGSIPNELNCETRIYNEAIKEEMQ